MKSAYPPAGFNCKYIRSRWENDGRIFEKVCQSTNRKNSVENEQQQKLGECCQRLDHFSQRCIDLKTWGFCFLRKLLNTVCEFALLEVEELTCEFYDLRLFMKLLLLRAVSRGEFLFPGEFVHSFAEVKIAECE